MDKETSEIVKLTERIAKDPKSKLFVPLAEEYKKTGDLEMAIYVLTEGLKNNPGYITARSFLGRILLEKGDLAGSRQELEEVVKAIPDNLMAQRKLGDLYILQDKPSEALKHYKSVLALNPRDEGIVSMISDLEAGRDVRSRIHQPLPQPSPEKAAPSEAKQQPQKAPAQQAQATPVNAPAAHAPRAEKTEAIKTPEVAPAPAPRTVMETEEPEEVLVVEPLDRERPEQEPSAPGLDFLLEQPYEKTHEPSGEGPEEALFASTDQVRIDLPEGDQALAEPDTFKETVSEATQSIAGEEPVSVEILETEIIEEAPAAPPVSVPEEAPKEAPEKSDDFRTDTLAELYIAQGFYEKAVDIYEQMLADNPDSRGLKDKLDRVKAMVAASVAAVPAEEKKTETDLFAEPQVYRARKDETEEHKHTDLFAEPGEYKTTAGAEEWEQAGRDQGTGKVTPPLAHETTRAKPLFTDFEPREYTPPEAEPVGTIAEKPHAAPKSPKTSRKETIDRLESWLRNIKKEA